MKKYGLHVKIPKKYGVLQDTPLTSMAFFLGPPQRWNISNWSEKNISNFKNTLCNCQNLDSNGVVVHGCYLINPASTKEEVKIKSEKRFLDEVKLCDKLNAGNYVFHPGTCKDTHKGLAETVDLIKLGLQETKNVNILVENMTKTNTLCQSWKEVEWVINHVNEERIGCCLDTAHCWGAGPKKGMFMDTLIDDYVRVVGDIKTLKAIHLNDSKVEYGSNKDRHEDILKGKIPKSFWNNFVFDERIKDIPTIMETPSNCHPILTDIINNKGVIIKEKKRNITDFFEKKIILKNLISENWKNILKSEFEKEYFIHLENELNKQFIKYKIYPPKEKIFNIFNLCPIDKIKVVILGQDCYHKEGQAEGLSFSVPTDKKIPSSLRNIYKELSNDIPDFKMPKHGHLISWVNQGVFLLNSSLTVREKKPGSHIKLGWQKLTDMVIKYINKNCKNIVFMLWGNFAISKKNLIDEDKHLVLTSFHPSGLSAHRGFFGCKHFSKCNKYLSNKNITSITWNII
jgi:uracil-DNA glycosylase